MATLNEILIHSNFIIDVLLTVVSVFRSVSYEGELLLCWNELIAKHIWSVFFVGVSFAGGLANSNADFMKSFEDVASVLIERCSLAVEVFFVLNIK